MKPAKLQTLGFEFKLKLDFGQNNKSSDSVSQADTAESYTAHLTQFSLNFRLPLELGRLS